MGGIPFMRPPRSREAVGRKAHGSSTMPWMMITRGHEVVGQPPVAFLAGFCLSARGVTGKVGWLKSQPLCLCMHHDTEDRSKKRRAALTAGPLYEWREERSPRPTRTYAPSVRDEPLNEGGTEPAGQHFKGLVFQLE